jgi:hypothetical protein
MMSILCLVVSSAVCGSSQFPVYPRIDVQKSGVEVPAKGTYSVWLWAAREANQHAVIAGQSVDVAADPKSKKEYQWVRAASLPLEQGHLDVELSEGIAAIALCAGDAFNPAVYQQNSSVFDTPTSLDDHRISRKRDTNTVFTMPEFASLEEWQPFADALRRRMLVSCGLWPMPEKTPLNVQVVAVSSHDDYIVEKVYFEAVPGFFVTGNLYRPKGEGPYPGVVCPHGHWQHGRLEDTDTCSVPGRCITFARMGMVAFSWDMLGTVDSQQFTHPWGHASGPISEDESNRLRMWGIHPFALQLWSSIRAVDFIQSLPYVDKERIGCTGASGGGTQTFALTAVDPRIKVSAPVNMISCNMQGGCPCENAPLIRIGASNMEIGALMAPNPMLLVSATGDWTKETLRVEYPAIRSVYKLLGGQDHVDAIQVDAGHNYNKQSREAVYRFFGKWLLGEPSKYNDFSEPPFQVDPGEQMRVFPDKQLPSNAKSSQEVLTWLVDNRRETWHSTLPSDQAGRERFLKAQSGLLSDLLDASVPGERELSPERTAYNAVDRYVLERWIIRRAGGAVPAILYRSGDASVQRPVLIVHEQGKRALASAETGGPGQLVQALIEKGRAVLLIDPFMTGDHHSPLAEINRVSGSFPDTFVPTDTAYRVQDILTAAAFVRSRRDLEDKVDVIGIGDAGMWCLMAAAIDPGIDRIAIDANAFTNTDDAAWSERFYVPSLRSTGDLATIAAFVAPRPLFVHNTGTAFDSQPIVQAYKLTKPNQLKVSDQAASSEQLIAMVNAN